MTPPTRLRLSRRELLNVTAAGGVAAASLSSPREWLPAPASTLTALGIAGTSKHRTAGATARPIWHITYSEDGRESLLEWVESHDDRTLRRDLPGPGMLTVAAPTGHIGASYLDRVTGSGLQAASFVTQIDPAISTSIPRPFVGLDSSEVWQTPVSTLEGFAARATGGGLPSSSGVAFDEDAEATTMDQARAATGADTVTADTSGLRVAVIDSGVNASSIFEDADGVTRIVDASKDFITGETVGEDGTDAVADPNGHGTFVASQIAANPSGTYSEYTGYLPAADILALRTLDEDGQGSTENIAAAVEYAADQDADLVCMSLGSPLYSAALDDALEYAAGQDTVPFVAVGNDRLGSIWTASPADSDYCLSVSATTTPTDADPDTAQVAYFANTGPDNGVTDTSGGVTEGEQPDLAAPGMKQEAIVEPAKTRVLSGTSMATPNAVGAAGLVLAADGSLGFDELRERLTTHALRAPEIAAAEVEYGIVNAQAAIDQTDREQSQSDAMSEDARVRDTRYRALSASTGGFLAGL